MVRGRGDQWLRERWGVSEVVLCGMGQGFSKDVLWCRLVGGREMGTSGDEGLEPLAGT